MAWYRLAKKNLASQINLLSNHINTPTSQILALNLLGGISGALLIAVFKPMEGSIGLLLSIIAVSIILILWAILTQYVLNAVKYPQQSFSQKLQHLNELTGILPDRVIILDKEGRYKAVLKHFHDPNSYQPENAKGQLLHEVLDKDFADYCLQIVQKVLAENTLQFIEYTFTHDSLIYHYEAHLAPFADPQSGEVFVIWFARDITKRKQAEQELTTSEQRLLSITSALPDRTVILDENGWYHNVLKIEHDSQTTNIARKTPLGKQFYDIFDKGFADWCLKKVRETIEKDSLLVFEYPFEQNGKTYQLEGRTIPYTDVISGEKRVIWISRNITERKQAEQALITSEKRLRSITSALPDRTVIVDADGLYHDVLKLSYDTDVGEEIKLKKPEKGQRFHDVFGKEFANFCLAKVRETIEKDTLQVFEYLEENQIYHMEGRTIPYTDIVTGEKRVIWISRDITERKKNEQAFIDSERLLHAIIGVLPDRTLIFDKDGRYQDILKAEYDDATYVSQKTSSIQVGNTLHEVFPKEFADFCLQMIRKAMDSGKIQIFEYGDILGIEKGNYYEGRAIPFNNPQTNEAQVLWISRDISSRKQVEEQHLELALEKEKLEFFRQFVNNMTHDLKTPLTVIDNSLYLLQRDKDSNKNQERLELARSRVKILTQMIDDMLVMAHFDSIPRLELYETDFLALLQNIINHIRPKAEHKHQDLHFGFTSESVMIQANIKDLSRALTNLIDNAIKYTPDKGKVEILVYLDNSEVITEIRDTGIGISSKAFPQIFNRFYRSENGRLTAAGTGLGLAITQRVIELHKGDIVVESEINQGSIFRVSLPIHQTN